MTKNYTIIKEEKPEEGAWGIIGRGVAAYNRDQAGDNQFQRVCYVLNDPDGKTVGGVLAEIYWGWLYIDLLWIDEELRRNGYGTSLMARIEEEARQMGATNAYLDTFSFQAPEFYENLGYHSFGELGDFPEGMRRFFMKKKL
jgi:GNAT superfamily N-acetyltransferase